MALHLLQLICEAYNIPGGTSGGHLANGACAPLSMILGSWWLIAIPITLIYSVFWIAKDIKRRRVGSVESALSPQDDTPTQECTESKLEGLLGLELDDKQQQFLMRAIESIDRNIDNTEYSVETLSQELSMNRMNIYRNFKSISEMTPAIFIRTIRLNRAAQWLKGGNPSNCSMVEISYMFGFNTPKYFHRHFKELFKETPAQYAARFRVKE